MSVRAVVGEQPFADRHRLRLARQLGGGLAFERGIHRRGFGTRHPSGRVSLANLNEADYTKIGKAVRKLFEEYLERYNRETGAKTAKDVTKK